ncbi:DUF4136 domain-containing protein [Pseudomonas sp. TTU2014-080ASC]|jgi:hypothetical protein|uniref:DUF4136 domain-containing protein n=1 Tax=Pseudomonas sp. TTU2014-080ASC TaxID=1729724 RepID=UPI000718467B|nr:DUF4136 domain-containing protein [Pseudomonas sp. TTU2014-080ASC]KRW61660.1 hypothetical protein AO726_10145 [Pseudomonas sp. TTU2014-080ASC]
MGKSLLLLPFILLLSACQSMQLDRDFDPNRDFAAYRSFSWDESAVQFKPNDPRLTSDLTSQRIQSAVNEQLEQRGLRPATQSSSADLKVQAWVIVDNRQEQITNTNAGWGYPWGYWGGAGYVETRTLDYQVGTLQIDLYDGKDGKLVWRGSKQEVLRDNQPGPAERSAAIRKAVAEVLSQYPPR